MTRRFGRMELIEKLADATCLDPRFKKQAFVNHQASEETVKRVTAAAAAVNPTQSEEENPPDSGLTANTGAMFWEDFDKRSRKLEAFCFHFTYVRFYDGDAGIPCGATLTLHFRPSGMMEEMFS
ncbi:hypothetical protein QTP86_009501 [Hemibagrus guttatus]|nr:hypothetical protein QTP86_009501 [Hemibagrus guttatus]